MGLRVGLGNGQHALFWFAAILTMFWLMRAGRPGWAGVALALSLHKYPLTVLVLPYMAAHRWFRVLAAGAVATAAALIVFAVGLRVESRQVVDSFLRELAWWYGQSGGGRLTGQGMTDFYPVLAALMRERAATIAMSGLLVAATAMACWPTAGSRPMPRSIDVAAVVLLMLFATYHRVYDTIVLIVPLCCLAAWWHGAAGWRRSVLGALGGLLALVWYVDPSAVYRRLVPMSLDHLPETGAFVVLDLAYRIVIAAALTMVVVLRYRSAPPMMLAVRSARA
jgi:hypothetical protein